MVNFGAWSLSASPENAFPPFNSWSMYAKQLRVNNGRAIRRNIDNSSLCSIKDFHKEYMKKLVVITVMKTELAIRIRHGWTKDENEHALKPKVANCGGGCGCGSSPVTEKTR